MAKVFGIYDRLISAINFETVHETERAVGGDVSHPEDVTARRQMHFPKNRHAIQPWHRVLIELVAALGNAVKCHFNLAQVVKFFRQYFDPAARESDFAVAAGFGGDVGVVAPIPDVAIGLVNPAVGILRFGVVEGFQK